MIILCSKSLSTLHVYKSYRDAVSVIMNVSLQWNTVQSLYISPPAGQLVCWIEFNDPVNTIKFMSNQLVYLALLFLGRLCPVSSKLVFVHILSTETDNCPPWISGRGRMTKKKKHFFFSYISMKKMLLNQAEIEHMTSWSPAGHASN